VRTGVDGRDLFYLELPPKGTCYGEGCNKRIERNGARGAKPRFCPECRKKRELKRDVDRRVAKRAWRGLDRYQRTPEDRIRLKGRSKRTKNNARYREHVCPDCTETFVAGHRSIRCYTCEVRHQRDYKSRWYRDHKPAPERSSAGQGRRRDGQATAHAG
jgi:hypothetical protein